jgi:Tol biopolymer transport system component
VALACLLVFVAACGDGTGVAVPALEVRTNTSGTELDPDGYTVVVDGAPGQPIGLVDTVVVDPLATGPHTVSLGGLADNCSVAGDATVQVTVTPDQTAIVEFVVVCGPTQGQIVVTTGTTGDPVDPDGYSLKLDDTTVGPIGVNEAQTLRGVPPGDHRVTLEGIALNCTVAGDNPRTVSVTAGQDAAVAFAVTCAAPAGTVHVSVATSGSPIDPDGYLVSLDGAASGVPIAATGSVNLTGVPVGSHSVALTGLAANCTSQSPNPVTVDVPLGGSVEATFTVSCLGNSQVITFGSSAAGLLAIFVVGPDGSGLTNLTPEGTFERNPIWSPDGNKLLFARLDPSFTSEVLSTMNPDGTVRTPLADGEQFIDYRWSPDGSRIAYSLGRSANGDLRSDLWVMQADGSGNVKLASDAEGPSWSPDGSQIAYVHDVGDVHIRIINSDGGNDHPLTEPSLSAIQPAWSPDGSRIAFTALGPNEIMVINPDGSGLLNLTNGVAQEDGPVWSPDGTRIAFNTGPADQPLESDVAVMNPDGSGRINLTNHPGFDLQPDWSPDGRQIVFVRMDGLDNEIYVMNSDGSNPIDVSNRPGSFESTPDWGGQVLAAVRSPLARFDIRSLRLAAMMERRVKVRR